MSKIRNQGRYYMLVDSEVEDSKHFFKVSQLANANFCQVNDLLEAPSHGCYAIGWKMNSNTGYSVNHEPYILKNNALIFQAPGELYLFEDIATIDGFLIVFSEDYFPHFSARILKKFKHELFKKTPILHIKDPSTQNNLERIFNALIDESNQEQSSSLINEVCIASLLSLFMITVIRSSEYQALHREVKMKNRPRNALYLDFLDLVDDNFREKHMVKDYAELLRISQKTLMICTSDNAGKTPLNIINQRINLEAKRLLIFTDFTITEISDYLGFKDVSYFGKFFKRMEHALPLEYRNAHHCHPASPLIINE